MINIGIYVHRKTCEATVKSDSGGTIERAEFRNDKKDIEAFAERVKKTHGDAKAACSSDGSYWATLHDTLEECGIDTVLAYGSNIETVDQANVRGGRSDSEVLADLLCIGLVRESFVPDERYRNLRVLTRTRLDIVRAAAHQKNRITAILEEYDHGLPAEDFSKADLERMRAASVSPVNRMALDSCLDVLETLQEHTENLERKIVAEYADDEGARRITTIAGIGYVPALAIVAEIADVKRFGTVEKLVSYAGLLPSRPDRRAEAGGSAKRGTAWLRHAMMEAAAGAARHDARMSAKYERLSKKMHEKKAMVSVAHSLTKIVWHMLTHGSEYRADEGLA